MTLLYNELALNRCRARGFPSCQSCQYVNLPSYYWHDYPASGISHNHFELHQIWFMVIL